MNCKDVFQVGQHVLIESLNSKIEGKVLCVYDFDCFISGEYNGTPVHGLHITLENIKNAKRFSIR